MNELIEGLVNGRNGGFVDHVFKDYQCFADLDGKHAAEWLKGKGYEVIEHRDTGRNGLAITSCGIHLSTNGFIHRKK